MAHFILLSHKTYGPIRVSVDRLLAYYREERPSSTGTLLMMSDGAPLSVKELPEQIDRLIDPTQTP